MSQLDDLTQAIKDEDVEIQDLLKSVNKVDSDVDALLTKMKAAGVSTDLTDQLQAIADHTTAIRKAAAQLKADDEKASA